MAAVKKSPAESGIAWTKASFTHSLNTYKAENTKTREAARECLKRIGSHTDSGKISSKYK